MVSRHGHDRCHSRHVHAGCDDRGCRGSVARTRGGAGMTRRFILVRQWCLVAIYAMAMAWVESACVYYLRVLVNRVEPYQLNPLPVDGGLASIEIAREASTLLMLLAIGALAGRTWRTRLGYAAIAFGIWDIAYYAFLNLMSGWPT